MDRFNALGRGAQIMLVAGVLLLIISFFDWQAVDDFPGVSAWDNFLGILMGLLTIVLIAWLAARVAAIDIPLPLSAGMVSAILAGLILLFAVLKNLTDDFSTIWSYLGVLLAVAIAIGAWMEVQAVGGFDTLRSEIPSGSTSTSGQTTSAPPPAAAPPPSAPEAAPEPYEPTPSAEPEAAPPPTEPAEPYDPDARRDA